MGDRRKTKQELLVEVLELRRRLQEAEAALPNCTASGPVGSGLVKGITGQGERERQRHQLLRQLEAHAQELQVANEELAVQAEELRTQNEALEAFTVRLEVQKEELERLTEELETERAFLRTVLEQMPAGVIIAAAPSGKFLLVNRQMEKILGHLVSLEDSLKNYLPYQAIHPDGRPYEPEECPLTQTISVGRAVSEEPIDVLREDGDRRTLQISAAPVRDRLGRIIAGVATYHDITERQQAEEVKRVAAQRVRDILESVTDAFVGIGFDWKYHYVNETAGRFLRRRPEELMGMSVFEAFPEAKGTIFEELFRRALEERVVTRFEAYYPPLETWFECRCYPSPEGISVFFTDTTARKRKEEALRRAKEEWELTFNAVPDLIAIIDKEYRIVRVNRAMAETLGAKPADLVDRVCHEVMHNSSGPPPFCPHSQLLADGREHAAEIHELNRDFLVSASPLTDGQGNLMGSVHVARDITERKRAEEEIQRFASFPHLNPSPVLEIDSLGRITYYNQATVKALEKIGGQAELNDFLPHDLEEIQAAARQKRVGNFYREIRIKDAVFVENVYFASSFDVLRIYATDITERKRAEAALRRAHDELEERVRERTADLNRTVEHLQLEMEERLAVEEKLRKSESSLRESEAIFRGTFDQSPVGAIMVGRDFRFQRVNAAFCNLTGYSEEELKSLTFPDITHPDDLTADLADAQRLAAGEIDQHDLEKRFLRKDGSPAWVRLTSRVMKDAAGRPLYFLAIIQDINARKQAEDKLRRQTAMLTGINRVFREALTCKTDEELGVTCLTVAEELTGSPFGFIGEVNQSGLLDILAFSDPGWEACRMGENGKEKLKLFSLKVEGLKGGVVREGRAVIANDPANHPEAAGLPPGHPPLTSYLGAPLQHGGKIIGLIGLANKEGGYTEADQEVIESLSIAIVEALMRFRAENKAARFSRLYRFLSQVNEAIVRAPDQETLFRQICRIAVEEGRFRMAWIGVVDQEKGFVKAVAQHGLAEGYLEKLKIPLVDSPESRGPTGTAVREGRHDICNDFANDPRMSPWREEALKRGYRSSGSFPLRVGSRVIGSLTMYAGEPGFFTDEEVTLLESLAHDVSFAMESMEREAQRRQAEAALKESEERLRYLASQLIDAQEAERRRVSLELHDDLGQSLMVLTMQLRAIKKQVPPDQGEILDHCNQALDYVYEIVENVRRLSRDLRPSLLEDLGLPAALRHLVETFRTYHGIDVSLDMDDITGIFAPPEEVNIYRIFQESLTNIAKYAQATQVTLTVKKVKNRVFFRVVDNGRGFDGHQILSGEAPQSGLGLPAMTERVRMLGGKLEIRSQEGQGTSISFLVPMRT